jgi:hypothetical protein
MWVPLVSHSGGDGGSGSAELMRLLGRPVGPKRWVAGAAKAVAACCWRAGLLAGLRGPRLAVGLEGEKGRWFRNSGFGFLKRIQTKRIQT